MGIEHAVEHGIAERPAVMEPRAVELTSGVTVSVDVDEPNGPRASERAQDSLRNRMIAAHRERSDTRVDDALEELFDVLVAVFQGKPAAKRHVADVADLQVEYGQAVERVVVGPDALDRAKRARAEARTGAIAGAQIHGHAHQCDLQAAD